MAYFDDVTADNWAGGVQPADMTREEAVKTLKVDAPLEYSQPEKIMTADEAYAHVLANVGATIPCRDAIDAKVINDVTTGLPGYAEDAKVYTSPYSKRRLPADSYKLGIITNPQQMGGMPEYKGTPRVDTDGDGMPDDWEKANGLNPNDKADATVLTESGYMNVELYINDLEYFKK